MKHNFLLCGSLGWCLEIFWTGFHALLAGQFTMMGKTSLLMFPIYGCAAVIAPVYRKISAVQVICFLSCPDRAVFWNGADTPRPPWISCAWQV